ncbi:TolC family protein [Sulfuricurvum sp. RIFCSPLOWO2_12_FULL_43_24]|uniref:TolC family protein n=1 Tax=Sulfuricurvum sp. RIFCSPLOWO2_12_FULL_43_24 TaxID=1802247 RepID=UPI0008D6639B|nr:TolC family protein [Sulfuricurvum sp. RIFCSPLOWO2_12_FULL_43_24]OHD89471.1 MAG: transporter [Sulfuricurvum sp. RIFCSPLOWO2_12_FULL_43_24]
MTNLSRIFSASLFIGSCHLMAAGLSLPAALEILDNNNLEIKTANLDLQSAQSDTSIAKGYNYGSLDFTQNAMRSNDAGNVFGFKLSSREADFGDFGFNDFLNNMGLIGSNNAQLLAIQPKDLNYPGYQNYFQSKLTYMVPLYTGGKLSAYGDISEKMESIKKLDADQMKTEKRYELRKSYYDMALLQNSIDHMQTIHKNISTLERTTNMMIQEGYAKKVDLLEVEARKANVDRSIIEMEANKKLLYHYLSFLLNEHVSEIELPRNDYPTSALSEADILANNTDLQKANNGLEIREKMVDLAYAPFLPVIGAFAEASTADNTFLGDFSDHKGYTIGARLSWNLFNGGVDKYSLEKARIEKLKTSTQVELAKKGIALQYDKIRTEIESLNTQVKSLEKEQELADQIYKNYEGRYHEHLVSMSDVIIKQSQQIEKVLNLQMVKNKRNERIFALEKLSNGVK